MNNHLKRIVSLMCALAVSLSIPITARAGEAGTASSTSIFVATDRHDFDGKNNLTAILGQVAADTAAVQPAVTLLGGDSVGKGSDKESSGHPAYTVAEPNAEIYSVLGDDVTTYYTFGSHDTGNTNGYSEYLSGAAECDGYYIYGISYAQMAYATDEQAKEAGYSYLDVDDANGISAASASANFLDWVSSLDDNMPIIVMSHVPLHVSRNDNLGAAVWCEALNKASETHDVVMLFGHNHTVERSGMDRYYYLVPAGSSMPVQGSDRRGDYSEPVTINFTYLNAGYITLGYGSLLTFTDVDTDGVYDELTVQRYSTTGKDEIFGNTGIGSPYTITLTQWSEKTDDTDGAGQTGTTTPDVSDAGQAGTTTPDESGAGQAGTTTPDVSGAGQAVETTTPDVSGAGQAVETTTPDENDAGQAVETTTPDESGAEQIGTNAPDVSDAEQTGAEVAPNADTEQSGETTLAAAVNTGDSVNVIYFFTLAVSSCVLLVLLYRARSNKHIDFHIS